MPVVRIWRRDGSQEPPRRPAAETKTGDAEVPAAQQKSKQEQPEPDEEQPGDGWDLEVRPHRAVRTARIVAGVIVVAFALGGVLAQRDSTGVNFRVSDQIAVVVIGLLIAAGVLSLTRPRVRVGARGVMVRNIVGDNEFQWKDIRGVSFPDKKSWARLELVHDEYVPMMAIRSNDKLRAAEAMDRFRELGRKYGSSPE